MNIRVLNIILGCFFVSLFFACNSEEPNPKVESCEEKVEVVNPNGDSELALLMRKMYLDADKIKAAIINDEGNITDEFVEHLEKVHAAIPTDPTVKTPEFYAFNKLLIATAKATQKDGNDKIAGFNDLVARCIDCHQSFCPGPIKRIKKLKIETTVD